MIQDSSCQRCVLHQWVNSVCLPGIGSTQARIMLVYEAPGVEEDAQGKLAAGKHALLLTKAMAEAGLTHNQVYITSAVRCRPPGNDLKPFGNAPIDACRPYLLEEIELVKPDIIVCLGVYALYSLTGTKSVAKARGKLLAFKKKLLPPDSDIKLVATIAPSYALKLGLPGYQQLADDLVMAARLVGLGPAVTLPAHEHIKLLPPYDIATLRQYLDKFDACREPLSIDLEWRGDGDTMSWPWTPDSEITACSFSGYKDDNHIYTVSFAWPPPGEDQELVNLLKEFIA